ncbi:MAG TPA: phage Gp37/Gp68 family protein [Ramlibacter sp.]|nr:phage Gp37/Gp68 family protein [Ramlibacter sp.]
MAESTEISWCDATFNPWVGCTKVSPGCDNCYAARQDSFRKWTPAGWGAGMPRKRTKTWGHPMAWNAKPFYQCLGCGCRFTFDKQGDVTCKACGGDHVASGRMRVFCASLADVFDNEVPDEWRDDLWELIERCGNLDFLLLTKRIGNAQKMMPAHLAAFPRNVWLGATIVNQEEADRDIPKLLATPAAVRFLSMEPLLGAVDLTPILWGKHERVDAICQNCPRDADCECGYHTRAELKMPAINWVIVGGESGPSARPMHLSWLRGLRDQCAAAGVPLHFKQWGEWIPAGQPYLAAEDHPAIREFGYDEAGQHRLHRIGKKAAGRLLDGIQHNAFPEA